MTGPWCAKSLLLMTMVTPLNCSDGIDTMEFCQIPAIFWEPSMVFNWNHSKSQCSFCEMVQKYDLVQQHMFLWKDKAKYGISNTSEKSFYLELR